MSEGTIANIGTIPDILMRLAKKAGDNENINIESIAEANSQRGGEWEFQVTNYKSLRNDDSPNTYVCSLELTYWLATNGCFDDNSKLTLSFPLEDEEKKKVINEVSKMIEKIKSEVQSDTK